MVADLSIWLSWLGGLLVAALLIGFIWWCLFADRSRGRPRCPRCWHDRTGAPGLRCAECGYEGRGPRDFLATRRRYGRALAAFALLVGATIAFRVQVTREGIAPFAPNGVLLALLPWSQSAASPPDELQRELLARVEAPEASAALLDGARRRVLAGDGGARPGTIAWQFRYGRLARALLERAERAVAADDPAREIAASLRALPPRPVLFAAVAAPPAGPLLVDLGVLAWWPEDTEAEVEIVDRADGTAHRLLMDAGAAQRTQPLAFAPPREGETARAFAIAVRTRATDESSWSDPFTSELSIDLTRIATVPPLEPTDDEVLGAAVAEVFAEGVLRWESGRRPVAFRIDASRTGAAEFAGTLIGVEAALLEDGVPRRRIHVWWPAGPQGGGVRSEVIDEDLEALDRFTADATGWTFRVRGIPEIAARAYVPAPEAEAAARPTALRAWTGERTMPAKLEPRVGEAPRRRWLRPPP